MHKRHWLFLGILLIIHLLFGAFAPGVDKLNDQEITALTGGLVGFRELIPSIRSGAIDPHPLPFWVFSGTLAKITRDPTLLRLPSMICSLLILLLLVRFGYKHLTIDAGIVAATIYAVSLPMVNLARTFGPDIGLMLLSLTSFHFFLCGWKRMGQRPWSVHLLATLGVLYWHYYGVVVYVVQWVVLGATVLSYGRLTRQRQAVRPPLGEALLSLCLAGVFFLPWFVFVTRASPLSRLPEQLSAGAFYGFYFRSVGLGSYVGAGIIVVLAIVGIQRGLQVERYSLPSGRVRLQTKTMLPTLLMLVVVLLHTPAMFAFHRATSTEWFPQGLLMFAPLFYLLAGIGVSRLPLWIADVSEKRRFVTVLVLAVLLASVGVFTREPPEPRRVETWEQVVKHLSGKLRDDDVVIVQPSEAQTYLMWVASEEPWLHLIKGEEWFGRHDAGQIVERLATVWLCQRLSSLPGEQEKVRVLRLMKIGSLDVGTEAALPYYVKDVDRKLEQNQDFEEPFTFSWALGRHAKLNFPLESNRAAAALIFRAAPFSVPQRLTVDLNKNRKCAIGMAPGWNHYITLFSPQWLGGQHARLDFRFTTHRPAVSPDGQLWRMKAVAFDYVAVFSSEIMFEFPAIEKEQEERSVRKPPERVRPRSSQRGRRR